MQTIVELLQGVTPILADGAMGTELLRRGYAPTELLEANQRYPEVIETIHGEYLQAGARIITANTFAFDIDNDSVLDAIKSGWRIARSVADANHVSCWLSLPAGLFRKGRLPQSRLDEMLELMDEEDVVLLETCTAIEDALYAVEQIRSRKFVLSGSFDSNGNLLDGTTAEEWANFAGQSGAILAGGNCGNTPTSFVSMTSRMREATTLPILIQPSAGLPIPLTEGSVEYPFKPEPFATVLESILDSGARVVGGCCGTTPAHIAEIHRRRFSKA